MTLVLVVLFILSHVVPGAPDYLFVNGFLSLLLVALVLQVWHRVIELQNRDNDIALYPDNAAASQAMITYINEERPSSADLLEFSSHSVESVLECLVGCNTRIRLLVHDPHDPALTTDQVERIQATLKTVQTIVLDKYDKAQIRLYSEPGALRGRRFNHGRRFSDDTLFVGWYTYEPGQRYGIYGHTNPIISPANGSREARAMTGMFERSFTAIWNNATPYKPRSSARPARV